MAEIAASITTERSDRSGAMAMVLRVASSRTLRIDAVIGGPNPGADGVPDDPAPSAAEHRLLGVAGEPVMRVLSLLGRFLHAGGSFGPFR